MVIYGWGCLPSYFLALRRGLFQKLSITLVYSSNLFIFPAHFLSRFSSSASFDNPGLGTEVLCAILYGTLLLFPRCSSRLLCVAARGGRTCLVLVAPVLHAPI